MRRRRVVLLAVAAAVAVAWFVLAAPHGYHGNRLAGHGCSDIPSGSAYGPYGDITSCRELSKSDAWFDRGGGTVYVLIDTDVGLVALRVEYHDLNVGRQYTATAYEVSASAADLGPKTSAKLKTAIDQRGGMRPGSWIVNYGDG